MYKNETIFYRNETIPTIKNFKLALPDNKPNTKPDNTEIEQNDSYHNITAKNTEAKSALEKIINIESVSRQPYLKTSCKRCYTLKDMLSTQTCLEALDYLETIKHASFVTYARQLLYQYLYSSYDISACNLLSQTRNMKQEDKCYLNSKIPFETKTLKLGMKIKELTPSENVRANIGNYLSNWSKSSSPKTQCGLYSNNVSSVNASKIRYYLPVYEIPIFLLLFTFSDRRDFKHTISQKNPDRLPYHKLKTDIEAYQLVLSKLDDIYKTYTNPCLYPSYAWRCDNIFLFYKFNTFLQYHDLYLSNTILDTIAKHYKFEYSQIEEIKNIILKTIFEDKDFITNGLKSNYLDFMLPFDILFQFNIFTFDYGKSPELFETELVHIKETAKQILNTELTIKPDTQLFSSKDDCFSISETENRLLNFLRNNKFYTTYYKQKKIFLKNYLKNYRTSETGFNFDAIAQSIRENTNNYPFCPPLS